MRKVLLASTIALLGLTSTAHAHFQLVTPPNTVPTETIGKGSPPCGPDTTAAATPTPAQGGHPLTLKIIENVPHDGFYRVALALHSRSELPVDNVVYDANNKVLPPDGSTKGTSARADFENPAVFPVLADNLFPHKGTAAMTFNGSVMLPNVNCDRCILQVIEFMTPHGFNTSVPGPGGGYFYHHCAELKVTADPGMPLSNLGTDGGVTDAKPASDGGAGSAGGTGAGGGGGSAAAGNGGVVGAAGSTAAGAAGSTSMGGSAGATGTGAAGAGGNPGAAGSTMTSGSAGTTGAAGAAHQSSGGGCALAPNRGTPVAALVFLAAGILVARRRRSNG